MVPLTLVAPLGRACASPALCRSASGPAPSSTMEQRRGLRHRQRGSDRLMPCAERIAAVADLPVAPAYELRVTHRGLPA